MSKLQADLCKFYHRWPFELTMYKGLLHPRFWPVLLFRVASALYYWRLGAAAKFFALLNQILFGCDIARGAEIDGGLYLPHPQGVVIGAMVRIGKNCIIHQGVTLGARGEEHLLSNPVVGDEVEIATGAKVLGGVQLGHFARIGANAVVLASVPDGGVAVGIPARVLRLRSDLPSDLPQATPSAAEAGR